MDHQKSLVQDCYPSVLQLTCVRFLNKWMFLLFPGEEDLEEACATPTINGIKTLVVKLTKPSLRLRLQYLSEGIYCIRNIRFDEELYEAANSTRDNKVSIIAIL